METTSNATKGSNFEEKVAQLFSLYGYIVKRNILIGGRQVDLYIEDRSTPFTRCYIVECKDQANPVNTSQYDSFLGRVLSAKREISPKVRGIFVASTGFVKEAKAQSQNDDIELITISELETSLIDFSQYISTIISDFKNDIDLRFFIEPNISEEHQTYSVQAYKIINAWLADPVLNQLTLLGDYGTGKTTLLKHLALVSAQNYESQVLETGGRARVPIFIDLRKYTQALSLKQIILDLLDTLSIKISSYAAFEYAATDGQLLIILDGFDEMASRGNFEITLRNFRELNKIASGKSKVIISSRTHYFTSDSDVHRYFGNYPPTTRITSSSYTDLYREIATKKNFKIVFLQEFNEDQVQHYLRNRCGSHWREVQSFIDDRYNLPELSRRPVFLDMIVSSAGKGSIKGKVTPGALYQVYTDLWLKENDWSTQLDINYKSELLEKLAFHLYSEPHEVLYYRNIKELIQSWNPEISEIETSDIDNELRSASFLVRDNPGNYKFSHKSFLEFFFSRFLLAEACRGNVTHWGNGHFSTEIYHFLRDLIELDSSTVEILLKWIPNTSLPLFARSNAIKVLSGYQDPRIPYELMKVFSVIKNTIVHRSAATALGFYIKTEVVDLLISLISQYPKGEIQTNCLISLARINDPKGNAIFKEFIEKSKISETASDISRWPLYEAAKKFESKSLIDLLIHNAPLYPKNDVTFRSCIELCQEHWSEEAEIYCIKVLSQTNKPHFSAMAYRVVPELQKSVYLNKMVGFYKLYKNDPVSTELVKAIGTYHHPDVAAFLVDVINDEKSRNDSVALKILSENFPNTLNEMAVHWLKAPVPYDIKIHAARTFVENTAPAGLEDLALLLVPRERVLVKIAVLGLISKHYKNDIKKIVEALWETEPSIGVKRKALEVLRGHDQEAALNLMLTKGIYSKKTGMRAAVCAMLAIENSAKTNSKLLEVLENDDSKWVRMQALKSLCSPGRDIDKNLIITATKLESNIDVLAVRKELLGE